MIKRKIRLLKKNKITVIGGFILGFSHETKKDIKETIDFAIDCGVDMAYFGKIPFSPEGIPEKYLKKAIRYGTLRFYCRPKIILNILKRMTHLVFLRSLCFRILSLLKR